MGTFDSSNWRDNRIDRVLVWSLRIILLLLLIMTLARKEFGEALILGAMLCVHSAVYLAAPRVRSAAGRTWAVTAADVVLGALAFYLTGEPLGLGTVVALCVAGIVATRLGLWSILGAYPGNAPPAEQTDERFQARLEELTALQRTTQRLNATLALEDILQVVLESGMQTTGATHGKLVLMDTDTEHLALRTSEGYSDQERTIIERSLNDPGGDGITHQVFGSGQARLVDDVRLEPFAVSVRGDTRSALAVPIFYEGIVAGTIDLCHTEVGAFDQGDLAFVQALAEQAAVAIGNALRFEDQLRVNSALRRRTEQMDGLLAVSQKLRADLPLEDALEEIAYAIQETVGFNIVMISIVEGQEGDGPMLRRVAAAGLPLAVFAEARRVRQPLERYDHLFREEYRQGLCYFFPFQKRDDWEADLHTIVSMPDAVEWEEGQWHPRDMLLAPLWGAGGRLLGHISVDEPVDGMRPSRQTLEALAVFANQAAVAIENTRLYHDAQLQAEQLDALRQVSQDLTALRDLDLLLNQIVDRALQLLDGQSGGIYLVRSGREVLEWAVAIGQDVAPVGSTLARGEGLCGRVWETGEPQMASHGQDMGDGVDRRPDPGPAVIAVPIQWGDQFLGVLCIWASRGRGPFTLHDAELLTQFSVQAAVAIQNAHLFQQAQRRVAELATVNQIARAISSALDVEQLSELIYNQVSNLLGSRSFFVALYDAERELIRIQFTVEEGRRQPAVTLKLGQGLTSHILATGQPLLLTDGVEGFIKGHGLTLEGRPARSWLGVPLIAKDRVIGAIAVQSYERKSAFDEDHLELLMTIAGQAAVAFQNASFFEDRERRIRELAVLNEMAQAISSTLDLDALLELAHGQIGRLIDTTNFAIALYDAEKDEIAFPFVVDPEHREDWSPRRGGTGPTGQVIESGEPLLLPRGVAGVQREGGLQAPEGLSLSWLGVPMIAEDKVLGVICVQSYEQEYLFGENDLRLLSTVAAQVAVGVRNAQLYQQIVRFNAELEERVEGRTRELAEAARELTNERDRATALYRITSELGTTFDLERVLQRALQLFADTLGVDHGTVLLLDQATECLDLRASLDREQRLPRGGLHTSLRRGVGLAGWVLEHRRPELVADIAEDPRWIDMPEWLGEVRSVVAAPLSLGGGDILGVLTLGHRHVGYFNAERLQLVTAAAAQVAVAVSNSDLYAFITDQADQLGATLQAMKAEADKSRAILESIGDGVLVLDHNGRVLLVNPAAEELLGFSAMVLEGEHFRHMLGLGLSATERDLAQGLYGELRSRLEAPADDAVRVQAGAVRLQAGNRVLAVNFAPLLTTVGQSPGLVAALRDISREAQVERLKNEFISTVSHELRTPMTSIKGYTDLLFLGMAGGLTDAQRNFLQIIKSNADRLTALVNDILDISRIETGRLHLTIEPLDLVEITSQSLASFQEQYRDKGLSLEWKEPGGLPLVRGDMARVTQVLSNLLANAWQYTPSGGRVTVSAHEKGTFVEVDIADTGIGIASDDIDRIFDRFYRVDHPVVQEVEGTGLGLSIVKMFVEMLGGEIWVESELGVGSAFSFTLPLMAAESPEEEIVQPGSIAETPGVAQRRPKILLVESNRDLALKVRRQLEVEGYLVLLAGTGEDALWLAREEQPQLITLDLVLPDLDGFFVLGRLKEDPVTAPIPVIIISVLTEAGTGYALGAVDYVAKPFEEDKLLRSVRLALSARGEGEQHDLLVVDDDPDILGLLDHALSFHGYHVRKAANGREALDRVADSLPDLILLDLKMPVMDGYEVIRRLKGDESTSGVPIIVITASQVDKEAEKGRVLGMGVLQYITKPLSMETLVREIRSAIDERRQ
jgi:PAS domain S-box-containing protein